MPGLKPGPKPGPKPVPNPLLQPVPSSSGRSSLGRSSLGRSLLRSLWPSNKSATVVLGALTALGLQLSCTGFADPPLGGLANGMRLITGELLAANAMELGQRDAGLQLAAVTFPGGDCKNPVYYAGPSFD